MSPSQPKKSNRIQRFLRWLFGTPFEDLGEPFGDPVPPEMHKFEAESDEITHLSRGEVMPKSTHHTRPRPSRH
jgi:hypothetical protein